MHDFNIAGEDQIEEEDLLENIRTRIVKEFHF